MTTPTLVHAPFCPDSHHPDGHCVHTGINVTDQAGHITNIAAFTGPDNTVGVYVGGSVYRPADAHAFALALQEAVDHANAAITELNQIADGPR